MRLVIATDAWHPQPNGVVRVVSTVADRLNALGHEILVISPAMFRTIPCPTYSEIKLAIRPGPGLARRMRSFDPEAIHIATEGPIGAAARRYCLRNDLPFTTAFHTKFPEYINTRTKMPLSWLYGRMRRFHAPSQAVMVPSPAVFRELEARGFGRLRLWAHGVDTTVFKPGAKDYLASMKLPRPIFMYVGRVTVDKNLPAFLDLDLPGSKVVIGTGPARSSLMRRYPDVLFKLADGDEELARYFNVPDAFVFPSRTDTFGLVMLEALACGVPVAAFPVTGPLDVIGDSGTGCLNEDLRAAALAALDISPERCRDYALNFSWQHAVDQFLDYLAPTKAANTGEADRKMASA